MFDCFDIGNIDMTACGGIGQIVMGALGLVTNLIGGGNRQESMPAQPASPGTEVVDPVEAAKKLRREQAAAQYNRTTTVGTGLGSGSNDSNNNLSNALGGV